MAIIAKMIVPLFGPPLIVLVKARSIFKKSNGKLLSTDKREMTSVRQAPEQVLKKQCSINALKRAKQKLNLSYPKHY
jgi:hypothetical protein